MAAPRYLADFMDAYELLRRHGIAVVHSTYVTSPEDAIAIYHGPISQYLPYPLTLKVISSKVPDKAAKGLVEIGLRGDKDIRRGFLRLFGAGKAYAPFKILAQPTVKGRRLALTVGSYIARNDMRMLYLGLLPNTGRTVSERAEHAIPLDEAMAESMIKKLHSAHAVAQRGRDLAMLKHFLVKVSRVVEEGHIVELELNPVILHENQYTAVDIKMYLDRAKLPLQKHVPTKKPGVGERDQMALERRDEARRLGELQAKAQLTRKR